MRKQREAAKRELAERAEKLTAAQREKDELQARLESDQASTQRDEEARRAEEAARLAEEKALLPRARIGNMFCPSSRERRR